MKIPRQPKNIASRRKKNWKTPANMTASWPEVVSLVNIDALDFAVCQSQIQIVLPVRIVISS